MQLQAGDVAPKFALPDENGQKVSSDSLKGKTYFLYFYPKDDTPGCTTEACQLNDNLSQFRSLGVPVLGVSQDDATSHQAFQKKYGLNFDLLTDADRSVHNAYGAWGERPGRGEGGPDACGPRRRRATRRVGDHQDEAAPLHPLDHRR